MADEPRQPVAIRVSRPYASEDEFLEHELETLTRTSVTLVGSQSRPQGVILRFEVALSNGTALLRGEGRVVAYKQNAFGTLPGLTLRFTRLDSKSKALVDRAASQREARARAAFNSSMTDSVLPVADASDAANATVSIQPSPSAPGVVAPSVRSASIPPAPLPPRSISPALIPPASIPPALIPPASNPPASIPPASIRPSAMPASGQPASFRSRSSVPETPARARGVSTPPRAPMRAASTPPAAPPQASTASIAPPHAARTSPGPSPAAPRHREPASTVTAPADRASLLDKLRSRGKDLSPDAVARILTKPTS